MPTERKERGEVEKRKGGGGKTKSYRDEEQDKASPLLFFAPAFDAFLPYDPAVRERLIEHYLMSKGRNGGRGNKKRGV